MLDMLEKNKKLNIM